jgi:hypothetical protein
VRETLDLQYAAAGALIQFYANVERRAATPEYLKRFA